MPDPAHILRDLFANARDKIVSEPVIGARKHHILPYHQAHLVTQIIKPVSRIESTAPHTYDIKMRLPAVFQQLAGPLTIHSGEDIVLGDIICAHREHALAIYLHGKGFPPLILVAAHGESAQADPALLCGRDLWGRGDLWGSGSPRPLG